MDVSMDMNSPHLIGDDTRVVIERDLVAPVVDRVGFQDGEAESLVVHVAGVVVAQDDALLAGELGGDLKSEVLQAPLLGEEQIPEVENCMGGSDRLLPPLDHDGLVVEGSVLIADDIFVTEV